MEDAGEADAIFPEAGDAAGRRCFQPIVRLALFRRERQGHGRALIQPAERVGKERAVGNGIDEAVDTAAAGQADVDEGRAKAVSHPACPTGRASILCLRNERRFQASARHVAHGGALRPHRELRADAAGKAALDANQRAEHRAVEGGGAQGVAVGGEQIGRFVGHEGMRARPIAPSGGW